MLQYSACVCVWELKWLLQNVFICILLTMGKWEFWYSSHGCAFVSGVTEISTSCPFKLVPRRCGCSNMLDAETTRLKKNVCNVPSFKFDNLDHYDKRRLLNITLFWDLRRQQIRVGISQADTAWQEMLKRLQICSKCMAKADKTLCPVWFLSPGCVGAY